MKVSERGFPIDKMWIRIDDTTWPRIGGGSLCDLEWQLRYGTPSKEELLFAASIVNAYRSIVIKPRRFRDKICTALRKEEK